MTKEERNAIKYMNQLFNSAVRSSDSDLTLKWLRVDRMSGNVEPSVYTNKLGVTFGHDLNSGEPEPLSGLAEIKYGDSIWQMEISNFRVVSGKQIN